jgi:uncharacterized protein (TIGR02246 family)
MASSAQLKPQAQAEIVSIVKALADSWNSHDMETYAAQFAEDANFINVLGMHDRGRAEIEARHVDIHRTIFRNSTLRTLGCSLRPLAAGVVLGHIQWEMTGHETPPGMQFRKVRRGVITAVFVEQDGRWLIAAFQNTDVVPVPLPGVPT